MNEDLNYNRIKSSMEFIAANFRHQPGIEEIADHVNMSESHFEHIFREWAGISPKKFLQYITVSELKRDIMTAGNLAELSDKAGLSSQSRVYDLFVKCESVTPQEYRTKGKGVEIVCGFHHTPYGRCFIATTGRGICALEFTDGCEEEFPVQFVDKWENAKIRRADSEIKPLIDSIFGKKERHVNALLAGTPFQIKVWEALVKIPYGSLTSYSSIAELIGKPGASRAVGTAIGSNNIAVVIPCHRVIQSLGGLGGYKWGEERKLSIIGCERSGLL